MIHPGFADTPMNKGSSHRIWLMTPGKAAKIMIKAVARCKKVLIYPFRMKLLYRFILLLLASTYLFLAQKMIGKFK